MTRLQNSSGRSALANALSSLDARAAFCLHLKAQSRGVSEICR
jgi:hypothetical protein